MTATKAATAPPNTRPVVALSAVASPPSSFELLWTLPLILVVAIEGALSWARVAEGVAVVNMELLADWAEPEAEEARVPETVTTPPTCSLSLPEEDGEAVTV